MTNRELLTVTDREQIGRLDRLLKTTLDGPEHLRIEYLRLRGWVAVPFESALHLDEADADRIATAATKLRYHDCNAIPTESLAGLLRYRVPITPLGLLEFSKKCSHFKYLLVPDGESFAILCSTDGYCVVAGPKHFVESALGKSIEAARDDFRRFVSAETWEPLRRLLSGVARRYETLSDD